MTSSIEGAGSERDAAMAWMEAVTSRDEKAALALSSPSIVYTMGGHLRHYEGHDGVRDIIEDFGRLSGFLTSTVLSVLSEPGVVAIRRLERYTLPDGGVEIQACSFVEVRDGVVTRWSDYKDMHLMNQFSA